MRWFDPKDRDEPVITAAKHVVSDHGNGAADCRLRSAFCLKWGGRWIRFDPMRNAKRSASTACFLDNPPCLRLKTHPNISFTKGGYGAPASADTVETVLALGVKK